jgi:ATP-binding cassette subfamily F protein 3
LLFVSHDRYFVDRVATKVIVIEAGRWALHEGNYSDYQHFLASTRGPSKPPGDSARPAAPASGDRLSGAAGVNEPPPQRLDRAERRKRRFPYRKVEDIEADIAHSEAEIADLEADLVNPEVLRDPFRIKQAHSSYAELQEKLAHLMEHWEEALELN